jgi:mRNA interferase RelE/StbE
MPEIVYRKSATRVLRRLDRKTAGRILSALEKLAEDPQRDDVDVIPLKGTEGFRLRVGDWRVLYDLEQEEREEPESDATEQVTVIMVQAISPRGGAYKRGKRR